MAWSAGREGEGARCRPDQPRRGLTAKTSPPNPSPLSLSKHVAERVPEPAQALAQRGVLRLHCPQASHHLWVQTHAEGRARRKWGGDAPPHGRDGRRRLLDYRPPARTCFIMACSVRIASPCSSTLRESALDRGELERGEPERGEPERGELEPGNGARARSSDDRRSCCQAIPAWAIWARRTKAAGVNHSKRGRPGRDRGSTVRSRADVL